MRVRETFHLTYCTNIHPGESWEEVRWNLAQYLPVLRHNLASTSPFGVGLRLSAQAAETLERCETLNAFQQFLSEHRCYVFTINGFPYGAFHGTRIKENVYSPDWMDERRLHYSQRLSRILATLLSHDPDLEGSISTVPLAFKANVKSEEDVRRMARLILEHAAFLSKLRAQTGKTISLALEPEPCCYLETVDEAVRFFQEYLFRSQALQTLARALEVPLSEAESVVRRHIGLCYDACHMAVEFEDPVTALQRIQNAGIKISKVQVSSALKLRFVSGDGQAERAFGPFTESPYLHQVVESSRSGLARYTDIPDALKRETNARQPGENRERAEWRAHVHIPIFFEGTSQVETTQDHLIALLDYLKTTPICPYLEVETYTWDILPEPYKHLDTASAITRELAWVRDQLLS